MEHKDYRLAAVMFTDIVGFSRMMEEDEKGTLVTLDFHNKLVREQVERFRGTVIKTIGDAFLAQFSTTLDAVQCSLAVQLGIAEYNEARLGKPLTLRIGVHLGDIYFYENDALGEGINIASRLQSLTRPGHITISREVYSQVSGKIPMRVEAMGQVHLKNITREVHAYEIIPGGEDNNSSAARKLSQGEAVPAPAAAAATDPLQPERRHQGTPWQANRPHGGPPPSFRDLRDEWRLLRSQIKDEVKRGLEGRPERWRDIKDQVKTEFQRAGMVDTAEFVANLFDDPADRLVQADGSPATAWQTYRHKKLRKAEKARRGFRGHLIPFLSVNAFLIVLYALATPGEHPWFLYPLFGWGIGLVSHAASVSAAKRTAREVQDLPDLNDEEFRLVKTFQDTRGSFYGHLASNTAVAALLTMIWAITGLGFPWPLIPIAAMAIGVASHTATFASRKAGFKALLRRLGGGGARSVGTAPVADEDPTVRKARSLKDSILAQAQGMKGGNPFGQDMTATLDNYVRQITELSTIEKELGRVVQGFNRADLEADKVALVQKIAATSSATLKAEYEKSAAELDKQTRSFTDLAEQQEILNLRLKSALGNLQQMQIDLARIKGLTDGQKEGYFLSIKDSSEELSRYLEDYREGLNESST